ncbi:MAG TPA: transglycosylase domain-containing protein [Saprospiraceae bacterium]|nr:transglycosylase domain-containing protein [Saprospiraceae bacterium]
MKWPNFSLTAVRAYLFALPSKIKEWIITWPQRVRVGIRDPKTRKKWLFQGLKAFGALILFLVFIFLLTWLGVFGAIPNKKTLLAIRQPEASKIYSVDGKLMGKFYTKNRNTLQFNQIPPAFMTALIATEDSRFWTHSGIDFRSWLRVLVKRMVLQQESAGGGSTLSQQLAKNLFPRKEYWLGSMLVNKFREFIIASRLENVYSKEDLLTFYINTVPFGEAIFGLDAAADRYFSKTADQLTIEECALLVGLLKATGYYNPRNNPDRALNRRNVVLHQMMVNGVIDSLALDSLRQLPLNLSYQRNTDSEGIALYFRNHIRSMMLEWCSKHKKENGEPYNLYVDGLKIHTTIDFGMQQYAEEALQIHMKKLQASFDKQFKDWHEYEAPIREAMERSPRYEALVKMGLEPDAIHDSLSRKIPMKWWKWDGMLDTLASPLDSVRYYLKMLQGAVVAINPRTGGVMAWVGGNDAQQFNIDYVLTPRQPGSAFKPILYATAIDQGMDPCTFYANRLIRYDQFEGWTPGNADGIYEGIYSLPGALAKSINTIAVQLIFDVGVDEVANRARRMGITGEMKLVPSLALGTAEITLLELVSAYNTFLNKGIHRPYFFISRIEDQDGKLLEEFKPPGAVSVFSPETVGVMDQMMANVVDHGTAAPLRYKEIGVTGSIAGKTGTTQFQSDGVFVGMTPKLVAGTWVGCFDRRVSFNSLRDGQGGKTALPIWGIFIKKLQQDPAYKSWFNASWPEEYKFINDCPFQMEEDQLTEIGVEPSSPRDSTYMGSRKFKIKEEHGIGHFLENLFKKKEDREKAKAEAKQKN